MTGNEIARLQLRTIGAIPAMMPGSARDVADALILTNLMLSSWGAERLAIFETRRQVFSLVAGTSTYTLGTGGTWNAARPVFCERAGIVADAGLEAELELPIDLVETAGVWAQVKQKLSTSDQPSAVYLDGAFPRRNVHVYPVPRTTAWKVALYLPTALTALSAETDYSFPEGYLEAILYNGCLRLCPSHGRKPHDVIVAFAQESLARIKRANIQPIELETPSDFLWGRGARSIEEG